MVTWNHIVYELLELDHNSRYPMSECKQMIMEKSS